MAFDALDDLLDESLVLPLGGRTYTVPAPSAAVGLRTQAIIHAAAVAADGGRADEQVLADAAERDLYRDVLGTAYEELVTDGVSWPALKHAAITAMVWIAQDRAAAETYWATGGNPSRVAPNREARRAASRSAAAPATPRRGSTSGTSTRQARTRASGRRAGRPSPGPTS